MKKAVAFRPFFGGTTVKRILSMDTVAIPIRMIGNGCILRPGFMKTDLKKKVLQILRLILMKQESRALFLVINTSATTWYHLSILQINKFWLIEMFIKV